ncbi:glycoside hydrolase family 24 protein [Hydrogenophaga intermedia]|uniref:glycoside hydrolase family 24 protein n=1 Tax=Hydrogenophaga intermedia TaxID=65786 RepID=UPI002043427F|nr:glycoside hydrolase family 104 protein [Hydrogenophaga intermedia]MCM3565924.1 glycoside hydrolase family 104 protein [Hydrogenophaga intermedia]
MRWTLAVIATVAAAALLATRRAQAAQQPGQAEPWAGISVPDLSWLDVGRDSEQERDQLPNLVESAAVSVDPRTYIPPAVSDDQAARNVAAFLAMIRYAEGTAGQGDPYRVCYGYSHTIRNLVDHPAVTGEWGGKALPDSYCRGAGFGPGCKSTAAGAYQIIRGTWLELKRKLNLPDFGPASQDAAAVELIRQRGALNDVRAGRFAIAVEKVAPTWASLPGAGYDQPERKLASLVSAYQAAGGTTEA